MSILIFSRWPRPDSQTEQALLKQPLLNVWHKSPQTQSYFQVTLLSLSTPTAGLGQDQTSFRSRVESTNVCDSLYHKAEVALLWARMKGRPIRLPDIWGPGVAGGVTAEFQSAIVVKATSALVLIADTHRHTHVHTHSHVKEKKWF